VNITRQEALDIANAAIELVDDIGAHGSGTLDRLIDTVNKVRRIRDMDAIRRTPTKKETTP
jgi:hypothetical protein